ncbi:hypothetical protein [Actinoplanes derwentensis]|uniref:Uncharacterized protein n=1 Tax=Actinoplanes derwentensis TaxID=113562 RepID=A0A1H1T3W0_9ACTN|nr:hypothetical protein [Actinoplanes derwentensis]GID89926.1 hypothetical protein Ade03nite_88500 [Actinoplanes derwentensis]SDS54868.1 hypothetical protein SAMN04489716_1028 [Actinoplanes derwentensis]
MTYVSDRLVRIVCGVALAVVLGAWAGSIAGVTSWRLTAPSLPDQAWGQEFAAELFPGGRDVRVDLIPEIAQYEDVATQRERLGFLFLGGDDYFPGQLIITARVGSPSDVIASATPVLRTAGWEVGPHATGEDVTAAAGDRTLWMTELYPDEVEVAVYRQTPSAVLGATATAWATGAVLGFVLGAYLGPRARSRPRARRAFLLGTVLSPSRGRSSRPTIRIRSSHGTSTCTISSVRWRSSVSRRSPSPQY